MTAAKILENLNEIDRESVHKFREYLRIPSVHPDIDYEPCVAFLKEYAQELGLPVEVHYVHPKKPTVVLTWLGKEPALSSVLLNGHMDVVPAEGDKWKYGPFEAEIDDKGDIYGRGAQDMKSLSVQYLEAIRRLKKDGVVPKRTVYVCFVSDEEFGELGFREFVKTEVFRKMNVGFAFDEGDASPKDNYIVYYGEKSCWGLVIHCPGLPGHASLMPRTTAGEKARHIVEKFSDMRRNELKKLDDNPGLNSWDVTSVNLTMMKGGVLMNVLPELFSLTYDLRIAPTVDTKELESTIEGWCREAGEGVWVEYTEKEEQRPLTQLENNPYWEALERVAKDFDIALDAQIGVGASDSRFLRERNVPALSMLPIRNTQSLAHNHDERLNVSVFLEGVRFMHSLLPALANV